MGLSKTNKYQLEVFAADRQEWVLVGTRKVREKAEQEGASLVRKYHKTFTEYRVIER